jgi:hypothetical protein
MQNNIILKMRHSHKRGGTKHTGRIPVTLHHHENKRVRVEKKSMRNAAILKKQNYDIPMPLIDIGIDRINELINSSVGEKYEDTKQNIWVRIIEEHPATEETLLQIIKEEHKKGTAEGFERLRHGIVSLDKIVGQNDDRRGEPLGNIFIGNADGSNVLDQRGILKPHDQRGILKPHDQRGILKPHNQRGILKPHNQRGILKPHNQRGILKPHNIPAIRANKYTNYRSFYKQFGYFYNKTYSTKMPRPTIMIECNCPVCGKNMGWFTQSELRASPRRYHPLCVGKAMKMRPQYPELKLNRQEMVQIIKFALLWGESKNLLKALEKAEKFAHEEIA